MTDTKTPETKMFHLGDILTITTDIMVSPNGVGGVYEILDYMTGENLFTHQLPRAAGQCKPILLELYPGIAAVQVPDATNIPEGMQEDFWKAWLAEQVLQFGEMLPVPKLVNHTVMEPIAELLEMKPDATIILFDPESPESEAKYVAERLANGN